MTTETVHVHKINAQCAAKQYATFASSSKCRSDAAGGQKSLEGHGARSFRQWLSHAVTMWSS